MTKRGEERAANESSHARVFLRKQRKNRKKKCKQEAKLNALSCLNVWLLCPIKLFIRRPFLFFLASSAALLRFSSPLSAAVAAKPAALAHSNFHSSCVADNRRRQSAVQLAIFAAERKHPPLLPLSTRRFIHTRLDSTRLAHAPLTSASLAFNPLFASCSTAVQWRNFD